MVRAHIDLMVERNGFSREFAEARLGMTPLPDTLPALRSLMLDEAGWIWAETYQWNQARAREWILFDTDRRARGTVLTPPRLEIHWIGSDCILGVWKDELGVEYVRRHTLNRMASSSPEVGRRDLK